MLFGDISGCEIPTPSRAGMIATLLRREDILAAFKDLWREQYLLSLREGAKSTKKDVVPDQAKTGDVVLIHSPLKPRSHWQLGKIVEPLPGPDSQTRCAKVMRTDRTEGVYSLEHLYPMELSLIPSDANTVPSEANTVPVTPNPRRRAAVEALKRIRNSNQ